MGKVHDVISPALAAWIERQRMFFVATAPLDGDGLVNCSPKGMDSFRILGPRDVAYLDLTGSGVETVAHLRENGRIVFMFCAFEGAPQIVRLHGTACVAVAGTPEYEELRGQFVEYPGARAIVRASLTRISDSCGYAVPRYDFAEQRDTLVRWTEAKGPAIETYRREKNAQSIDGLPGLPGLSPSERPSR
jgi:hypothetical protein